jgi:hypothetical protein
MIRLPLFLPALGLVLAGLSVDAQSVNKDSLSLANKISADKEKVTKLQGSISDKEKLMQATADQAQESADNNRKAANKLSDNPQDKRLAKKADQSASTAREDSKKARNAADDLDNIHKEIRSLSEKIAKEEARLRKYMTEPRSASPEVSEPKAKTDSL